MKKQIQTAAVLPIMPVSIIGTLCDGKANFAPHGQIATVTAEPPVIYTSVVHAHKTAQNILQTGRFSVSIPSADLLEKMCICGQLSGAEFDKSVLFETFEADGVPMIQDCAICFACEVIQHTALNGFDIFLAQVTATFAEERCLKDGLPIPRLVDPLLCSIDGKFWVASDEQVPLRRCQSCGLPFDADHVEFIAKDKEGKDTIYCTYCYDKDTFSDPDASVADMIEMGVPHLARKIGEERARQELGLLVPSLARWRKA